MKNKVMFTLLYIDVDDVALILSQIICAVIVWQEIFLDWFEQRTCCGGLIK